jgi:hypothetical protein
MSLNTSGEVVYPELPLDEDDSVYYDNWEEHNSGSGTGSGTADTPEVLRQVAVSSTVSTKPIPTGFNNTKMSNHTGLHLPEAMKLKGEENYIQ